MRVFWRRLLMLLLVGSAGLLAFLPEPARAVSEGGDESEPAHRPAVRWREEESRRLKDEWKAFQRLPEKQQLRLRHFDEELNDEPPVARSRLWAVLARYSAWLERLDEKDRRQLEAAPDAAKKLEIIKALREREWVTHLAKADRERIEQAGPEERAKLIEQYHQKERHRRAEWQAALRMQDELIPPRGQPEFLPQLQLYVNRSLSPTLPPAERVELQKAKLAPWPEYAQKLTSLAEKHPILLPPSKQNGVIAIKDLPTGYLQSLSRKKGKDDEGHAIRSLQGRWPNFALEVAKAAREKKVPLPEKPLGPCKPEEFVEPVQRFITELRKDGAAAKKLDETQNKWPDYPLAVMELAKARGKKVPGTFLPGDKAYWDQAKAGQAE